MYEFHKLEMHAFFPSLGALKLIYSTFKLARNDPIFFFIIRELSSS